MLDLVQGPNPPTPAQIEAFDADWRGVPHRDLCVTLEKGKATIKVAGLPDYELYYVPQEPTQALETKGKIEIIGQDPNLPGTVCLGVQQK
jgi:hypothetical protein